MVLKLKDGHLLAGMHGHVNLIPVNPIKERSYAASRPASVHRFQNILEKNGINVTIRREMGRDIGGACGQLRKSFLEKGEATLTERATKDSVRADN